MPTAAAKWAPSAVVVALIAAGIVAVPLQANAVNLPEKSAEDIIALMTLEPVAFSGTIASPKLVVLAKSFLGAGCIWHISGGRGSGVEDGVWGYVSFFQAA